ncbi:hypothetical protein D3C81_2146590 [compost metagenome]
MLAPANGFGQAQLLPIRGLPIQYPLETQMKAASRALIAVLRGREDDAAVASQHGLQQRGRDGGSLVHQQQRRLKIALHQPVR